MSKITILKYCIARSLVEGRAAERAIDPGLAEKHRAMMTCFNALILEIAPPDGVTQQ